MKYCVVYAEGESSYVAQNKLAANVNELLAQGWQIQGGVSISTYMIGYYRQVCLAQALIKPTD